VADVEPDNSAAQRAGMASGAAERAGVQAGDVLLAIDGRPVTGVAEASHSVAGSDRAVALLLQRGERKLYIRLRLI